MFRISAAATQAPDGTLKVLYEGTDGSKALAAYKAFAGCDTRVECGLWLNIEPDRTKKVPAKKQETPPEPEPAKPARKAK